MAQLLLLTNALAPSSEVLPALGLLPHQIRVLPAEAAVLVDAPPADAVIVDGRRDLAGARSLCRLLRTTGLSSPLLLVLTEGGMAAVAADWGVEAGPSAASTDASARGWREVFKDPRLQALVATLVSDGGWSLGLSEPVVSRVDPAGRWYATLRIQYTGPPSAGWLQKACDAWLMNMFRMMRMLCMPPSASIGLSCELVM